MQKLREMMLYFVFLFAKKFLFKKKAISLPQ